jgi:curved DNA-binding protein CbpA
MRYHPDKHNRPEDLLLFNEVKEAYEILSNPARKENYLQERWLRRASGQTWDTGIINAPVILKKSLELNKQIAAMDAYRMNYSGIAQRIIQLLSDEVIQQLHQQPHDAEIHTAIVTSLLHATRPLPHRQAQQVAVQLQKLVPESPSFAREVHEWLRQKEKHEYWHNRKGWLVAAVTLLICLLMYFMNR